MPRHCLAVLLAAIVEGSGAVHSPPKQHDCGGLGMIDVRACSGLWDGTDFGDEPESVQEPREPAGGGAGDGAAPVGSRQAAADPRVLRRRAGLRVPGLVNLHQGASNQLLHGGAVASHTGEQQLYVLLGPPDSGTNLLMKMIKMNWRRHYRCAQERSPFAKKREGVKASGKLKKNVKDSFGELWKHSNSGASDIYAVLEEYMERKWSRQKIGDTVAIIMVRSPISQIVSWKKAPYELGDCAKRDYKRMRDRCAAPLRARRSGQIAGLNRQFDNLPFSSTMDVYNRYLQQYRALAEDGRFKKVLVLAYEDLVFNPEEQLKRIAEAFGVQAPDVTVLIENEAKNHGEAVGRQAAIQKITGRAYLAGIAGGDLQAMCQGLDMGLVQEMSKLVRRGGDTPSLDYTSDCRDYLGNNSAAGAPAGAGLEAAGSGAGAGASGGAPTANLYLETSNVDADAALDEETDADAAAGEEADADADADEEVVAVEDVVVNGPRSRAAANFLKVQPKLEITNAGSHHGRHASRHVLATNTAGGRQNTTKGHANETKDARRKVQGRAGKASHSAHPGRQHSRHKAEGRAGKASHPMQRTVSKAKQTM